MTESPYSWGEARDASSNLLAHRLSWELHFGRIPSGIHVCHKCDNPRCVNPAHLFLGTDADNVADMWQKGRGLVGSQRRHARLTEGSVLAIRRRAAAGEPQRRLAREYGVSRGCVYHVVHWHTWRHVGVV